MKLHVYCIMRNERYMAPYFLRHYETIADRIFVWDDDSDDGTVEILKRSKITQVFRKDWGGMDDARSSQLYSEAYRTMSRGVADWVIVASTDEFHVHKNLHAVLSETSKNSEFVLSRGWNMLSKTAPETDGQLYDVVRKGIPDLMYNRIIFRPSSEVTVGIGCHSYSVDGQQIHRGDDRYRSTPVNMLHMRYLGEDYITQRHQSLWDRTTAHNREMGWSIHASPAWTGKYSLGWFRETLPSAIEVPRD